MSGAREDEFFVIQESGYRVAFPCEPSLETTRRGGVRYRADKGDCSVLFVHDRLQTSAEADRELEYDYKAQFTEDGYDDYGERSERSGRVTARFIEVSKSGSITRITELVDGCDFFLLIVESDIESESAASLARYLCPSEQQATPPPPATAETVGPADCAKCKHLRTPTPRDKRFYSLETEVNAELSFYDGSDAEQDPPGGMRLSDARWAALPYTMSVCGFGDNIRQPLIKEVKNINGNCASYEPMTADTRSRRSNCAECKNRKDPDYKFSALAGRREQAMKSAISEDVSALPLAGYLPSVGRQAVNSQFDGESDKLLRRVREEAKLATRGHGFVDFLPQFLPTCLVYNRDRFAIVPFVGSDGDCPHHVYRPEGAGTPDNTGLQIASQMFGSEVVGGVLGLMKDYANALPQGDRSGSALKYMLDEMTGVDPAKVRAELAPGRRSPMIEGKRGREQPPAQLQSPYGLPPSPAARRGSPLPSVRQSEVSECLEALKASRPTLIFCSADWAAPSRHMERIVELLVQQFGTNVDFIELADESPEQLGKLGVTSVPTFIGSTGGQEKFRVFGLRPDELIEKTRTLRFGPRKPAKYQLIATVTVGAYLLSDGAMTPDLLEMAKLSEASSALTAPLTVTTPSAPRRDAVLAALRSPQTKAAAQFAFLITDIATVSGAPVAKLAEQARTAAEKCGLGREGADGLLASLCGAPEAERWTLLHQWLQDFEFPPGGLRLSNVATSRGCADYARDL